MENIPAGFTRAGTDHRVEGHLIEHFEYTAYGAVRFLVFVRQMGLPISLLILSHGNSFTRFSFLLLL